MGRIALLWSLSPPPLPDACMHRPTAGQIGELGVSFSAQRTCMQFGGGRSLKIHRPAGVRAAAGKKVSHTTGPGPGPGNKSPRGVERVPTTACDDHSPRSTPQQLASSPMSLRPDPTRDDDGRARSIEPRSTAVRGQARVRWF